MALNITNLPIEIILEIFSHLNRSDIILNCAKTTRLWKYIVSKFYIEPFINFLAEHNNSQWVVMVLEGGQRGLPTPQNFAWKRGEFSIFAIFKNL